MGGGPESRCVGRVYSLDGAVRLARHHPHRFYLLTYLLTYLPLALRPSTALPSLITAAYSSQSTAFCCHLLIHRP